MDHFFYRNLKKSYPVAVEASGVWVTDSKGNRFLDGCSGAVVANIGHGVPEVVEAVSRQLGKLAFAHTSQFVTEAGLELSDKVFQFTSGSFSRGRAYFVSGGSEAVETALKLARTFYTEQGQGERHIVISRRNSYHGSTQGALRATGHPARRRPYLPMLGETVQISPSHGYRCPCGAAASCRSELCGKALALELEAAIVNAGPENVMAFIAEPVVGAALGASDPHAGYWNVIREICNRHGVLLLADEVMTGLGRLGTPMGLDLYGVEPDIVILGKGLSAGYMPLGAVLAGNKVVDAIQSGSGVFEHGFTYSAHPPSCAAGVAVLDYMKQHNLVESVNKRQADLFSGLKSLARGSEIVGDVRGKGFLCGLEIVQDRHEKRPFDPSLKVAVKLAETALGQGLLVYPGSGSIDGTRGDHIIIAPPFTVSDEEMASLFERLGEALRLLEKSLAPTMV